MSALDPMAARKIVDDHRKGRILVSCEVAYRVVESLVATQAALKAQVECTTRLAKKLEFTDADIRDFTSQARLALGEIPAIHEAPRDLSVPLRVRGVGRVADAPCTSAGAERAPDRRRNPRAARPPFRSGDCMSARLDRAEYLAGYLAGIGLRDTRVHYANHEPHYHRGLIAGVVGLHFGVDLSGGPL